MNQMKNYFKGIIVVCLAWMIVNPYAHASSFSGEDYAFFENTPLYSFTDKIEFYTLSRNNETIAIQTESKQTSGKKLYITHANGTGLADIFTDGEWSYRKYGVFLEMKSLHPLLSGNGEVLIQGVIPTHQVEKKSDYFFIYFIKTKKSLLVSLKVLFPGCSIARFQKNNNETPYSVDFNGKKIIASLEMGTSNEQCQVFDSVITSMNIDGSNQTVVYGPTDFSSTQCRFTWKSYPKSPRHAVTSYSGDKIFFFGSIYESDSVNDKNGEIFVMNADGSNIRQLTFSKKLEPKPEQAGPFITNYYGSRLYYQIMNHDRYDLLSIGMDGSLPEKYFSFPQPIIFSISTDGKRIFFSHPEKKNSLVFFDVVTQRIVTLLDFTKPSDQTRYGILANLSPDDWAWTNTSDFTGTVFLFCIDQEWIIRGNINSAYIRPTDVNVVFQVGFPVATINHQRISLSATPYLKNNRIMIPASTFFQAFGFPYKWYTKEQVLECKQDGNIYQINPAKSSLHINGKLIKTFQGAEFNKNQVFIPGYWARDYFLLRISWDNKLQILLISK